MSPPVLIGDVDPLRAVELIGRAGVWLSSAFRQDERSAQAAALLLRDLGALALSLHALQNAGRAATTPLLRYSPDWTDDQKREAFDLLDRFLNESLLMPEIRRSTSALEWVAERLPLADVRLRSRAAEQPINLEPEVLNALDRLPDVVYGAQIICATIDGAEPLASAGLVYVWEKLSRSDDRDIALADSADAVRELSRRLGSRVRQFVPREFLTEVDSTLGRVQAAIATRHPRVPRAGWLSPS